MSILEAMAASRAGQEAKHPDRPYVCHLTAMKADELRSELAVLGVAFGIPLGMPVPDPRESENEWEYMGIVLSDVHVYRPLDAG